MKKVWIGADHRGRKYKKLLKEMLVENGYVVEDAGTNSDSSVDYTDLAIPVAKAVRDGEADRGVLICASGIGMSIAANRFSGVRAALCLTTGMAETARRHNDSNVLCLAQDITDEREATAILQTWLNTDFDGGRHCRRIKKMDQA